MKYLNFADFINKRASHFKEVERLRLKSLVSDCRLPNSIRFFYSQRLALSSTSAFMTRSKGRCLVTSNSKSVYRSFKLNRITLREFISFNMLPGIKKSGW